MAAFLIGMLLYTAVNFYFSSSVTSLDTIKEKLLLMWVNFVIHTSYGLGFLKGIFKFFKSYGGKNFE